MVLALLFLSGTFVVEPFAEIERMDGRGRADVVDVGFGNGLDGGGGAMGLWGSAEGRWGNGGLGIETELNPVWDF